ncbi:M23 family metallopeptidase [Streptomyces justiciae]|uniref:M23 family metallopeptidase n=1 Tax=Streptomyces justiciae TaxID=2780140 RepID=A0ABU3LX84_9ACTN|nr:M23 family metallopeptidase [Streptomyces justiciae]MDT7843849.1 M23 family metallopeptidase [Streptomyces justiciae]
MRKRNRLLTGLLTALALAAPTTAVAADEPAPLAKPAFLAPFECESQWTYSTYPGHGNVLDFVRSDGKTTPGSPVLASAAGTATRHNQPGGGGQYIRIDHGDGWITEYMHLATYEVPDGTQVEQGRLIGTVGSTGNVTGPHLHYEQELNGVHQDIELEGKVLTPYPGEYGEKFITSTNGCDGDPGEPEPPVQKDTALTYDGPATIANGSPAPLSATLKEKESGTPVADREVTLALGANQSCKARTTAEGKATCTIEKVAQPLTDSATVPLKATFAGDEAYKASEATAELKLQYVTGRAYGLSATVPVLVLPVVIAPTPDTGEVRTADAKTTAPPCTQNISALVLTADALCADVTTTTGPSTTTAKSMLTKVSLGLPGLPVVEATGVTATSKSTCEASTGATDLKLTIAGTPVTVPNVPNYSIDLGPTAKLVVNEQLKTPNGLTVNALHLTALGGADVVVASSTSGAHNCA